jgi:predicted kinase
MPERPTLIATVGLPRSGKSTWARRQGVPVVNPDSIRLALHGQPFIEEAEPWVWLFARTMVRSLFLAGHPTVILDATNVTRRRRREWVDGDWELRFEVFRTPAEVCIERALADGREYLVPVIERMAARFEPVDPSEGTGAASPAQDER